MDTQQFKSRIEDMLKFTENTYNEEKEFFGRTVKGLIDYQPNIVHNGIAFSLNCKF